jgi:hypothetical protein
MLNIMRNEPLVELMNRIDDEIGDLYLDFDIAHVHEINRLLADTELRLFEPMRVLVHMMTRYTRIHESDIVKIDSIFGRCRKRYCFDCGTPKVDDGNCSCFACS